MSKVDTTFGPLASPLVKKWGRAVTFHKAGTNTIYDPSSGGVTATTTNYAAKAVVTRVTIAEVTGLLQSTDYKIIIDAAQINGAYITARDSFSFTRNRRTVRARVIDVTTLEGESAILHTVFVRPE